MRTIATDTILTSAEEPVHYPIIEAPDECVPCISTMNR